MGITLARRGEQGQASMESVEKIRIVADDAETTTSNRSQFDRRMKPTVMIVEDEEALLTLLQYNLDKEGYRVHAAADGEEADLMIRETTPDLILLDWMLPGLSGIELCRRLRGRAETRNVPIIMITARGEETDRIRGLDIGADDYVTKPFSMTELLARIRAVMRRIRPALTEDLVTFGDIVLDRAAHRVRRGDREVRLGPTEYRLLDHLIQYPGRVFSREQLLDAVWGSDVYVEARTVDVHVGRLRKALSIKGEKDPIRTVRSAGYSLDEQFHS
jgi:two-component system phosphate regulon response regulator PhoB